MTDWTADFLATGRVTAAECAAGADLAGFEIVRRPRGPGAVRARGSIKIPRLPGGGTVRVDVGRPVEAALRIERI